MLITNIYLKGLKSETEKLHTILRALPGEEGPALIEITERVYSSRNFLRELKEVKPFSISHSFTQETTSKFIGDVKTDPDVSDLELKIIQRPGYDIVVEGEFFKLMHLPPDFAETPEENKFKNVLEYTEEEAMKVLRKLNKDPLFKNLNIRLVRNDNYHVVAEGKRANLKELPKQFTTGPNIRGFSTTNSVRNSAGFPFTKIEKINNMYIVNGELSLDEFCNLKRCSFDSEFRFWEKEIKLEYLNNESYEIAQFLLDKGVPVDNIASEDKEGLIRLLEKHLNDPVQRKLNNYKEEPMSASIGSTSNGYPEVFRFEHLAGRDETIELDLQVAGKTKIHRHRKKNAEDLVDGVNKFIESEPPFIIVTTNGMSYDFTKLKHFGLAFFESAPRTESAAGFFNKVVTPGFYHIDLTPYSSHYYPFTIDNKFETIMSLINKVQVRKKSSYDDLTRMSVEMLLGREESALDAMPYESEDAILLDIAAGEVLPLIYLKSKLFKTNPESVCSTSKRRLALVRWWEDSFEKEYSYPWLSPDDFKKYTLYDTAKVFEKKIPDEIRKKISSGVFPHIGEGVIYYINPFTNVFRDELKDHKDLQALTSWGEEAGRTTLQKFDARYTVEEGFLCPYIFTAELDNFKNVDVYPTIDLYEELVLNYPPLNKSGNFIVFPKDIADDYEFKALAAKMGMELSRGKLYNISKGSFAIYDGVTIFKKGVDMKGKRGFKSICQTDLISSIIHSALEEHPEIAANTVVEKITTFVNSVKNGSVEREKLLYIDSKLSKNYFEYSSYALRQERIKAAIQFGVKEGEELSYAKLVSGRVPTNEFLNMPSSELFSEENIEFIVKDQLEKVRKYVMPLGSEFLIDDDSFWNLLGSGSYETLMLFKSKSL